MSDEEARPEDNPESEDKDSFSQFIHDNLNMDGMPDAPNNSTKAKDDEPPTNPFTSRFGKPPTGGFSRFGTPKSDFEDFDNDDDDPFTGSSSVFGKKSPFSGDNKDRPTPFGSSGSRFGGGSGGSSSNSGNRFGGGNSENNPFGRFGGGDKNPPPPPSPFSALGRLSTNKQHPSSSLGQKFTPPKTKEQKRTEFFRNMTQLFKDLLPSILLLLLLIYFISVFSQYQPDVLKGDIQDLQATIEQQNEQIRQLQSQLESMSRER
ncbi:MAG: hypothetical protein MUE54_02470 [Anaerolineae bacterium]|nr:hypothetical protein [Anaerolineae bacterium]